MNELYRGVTDLSAFIRLMGAAIAHSGFYGCKNEQQGCVIAWHCVVTGDSPLTPMQEFDVFNTSNGSRLRKKSEAMLRTFQRRGGTYEWLSDGKNGIATITFEKDGKKLTVSYSLDDAKTAQLLDGKNPNWKTRPQNMLRSRVTSEGLRMFDPASCEGCYTPDEIDDLPEFEADKAVIACEASPAAAVPATERKTRKKADTPVTEATQSSTPSTAAATGTPGDSIAASTVVTSQTQESQEPETAQEPASAVATEHASTTTATAPSLPQKVADIIALRDYVGPRWPADHKSGAWPQLWAIVKQRLNIPAGETDEEQFCKAPEPSRDKAYGWLNQQKAIVDKMSTSKDVSAWANQNPTTTAAKA